MLSIQVKKYLKYLALASGSV